MRSFLRHVSLCLAGLAFGISPLAVLSDNASADAAAPLAALTAGLDAPAREALGRLQAAERVYADAAAEDELDHQAPDHDNAVSDSLRRHAAEFATLLRELLTDRLPPEAAVARPDAERLLNASFAKVMALKDVSSFGTLTKERIKASQLAWLAYRDAFLQFAATALPDRSPDALATELALARAKDLGDLLETLRG